MIRSCPLKIFVLFFIAFLTGINFVVFPALGTAFTDRALFGLSQAEFGNLFIPQTICIVIAALVAPFWVNRSGPKFVMIVGLILMMMATAAVFMLQFFLHTAFPLDVVLLTLTACVGSGFGLVITTLNPVAASFFPEKETSAILILQFLVGVGTSSAPLMMSLTRRPENWIYIPAGVFCAMLLFLLFFLGISLEKGNLFKMPEKIRIPRKLWFFFLAILIYGFLEGTLGGFGAILLKNKGLDATNANLGMALFWGGVAINRLLTGVASRFLNLSAFFLLSPLCTGVILYFLPAADSSGIMLLLMCAAGFFMGSIFPGAIGWGTIEFPVYAVVVSGFLMAADQLGTGIITQILGRTTEDLSAIIRVLSGCGFLITLIFWILSRNSLLKKAF